MRDIIIPVVGICVVATIAVRNFRHAHLLAKSGLSLYRQVDGAKDQYALENSKEGFVRPTWADLTPYLKAGSKLADSGGKDNFDNPIIIGSIAERLRVHPKTKEALKGVRDETYWGPYS